MTAITTAGWQRSEVIERSGPWGSALPLAGKLPQYVAEVFAPRIILYQDDRLRARPQVWGVRDYDVIRIVRVHRGFQHPEASSGKQGAYRFCQEGCMGADVTLLDEPFSALDAITRVDVRHWFCAMLDAVRRRL